MNEYTLGLCGGIGPGYYDPEPDDRDEVEDPDYGDYDDDYDEPEEDDNFSDEQ